LPTSREETLTYYTKRYYIATKSHILLGKLLAILKKLFMLQLTTAHFSTGILNRDLNIEH